MKSTLGRDGREREVEVKEEANGRPETANAHSKKTGGEGVTREGVMVDVESVDLRQAVIYMMGQIEVLKGQKTGTQNMGRDVNTKVNIRPEDGGSMKAFLDMIQVEFMDVGLEVEQWGTELRRHLTGEAMAYWLHIYETGTNFKDWRAVKRMFMMRFCANTKDEVLAKLADTV